MPIKSIVKHGIIFTEIIGEINYDLSCQQIDFIVSLKDEIKNHYEFSDLTNVTGINLSAQDMEKIAHYIGQKKCTCPHTYLGYYVINDFQYGMARMFKNYLDIAENQSVVEVFRDKEEAIKFLKGAFQKYG